MCCCLIFCVVGLVDVMCVVYGIIGGLLDGIWSGL